MTLSILGIGSFTLNPNATSTTVQANCTPSAVVLLSPAVTDAANDIPFAAPTAGNGQFTVTHANNSRTDRLFNYVIIGVTLAALIMNGFYIDHLGGVHATLYNPATGESIQT